MNQSPLSRRQDGWNAERLASHFLESKGFRPLAANYTTRFGEIDLIMEDRGTIVFVEVKRRRNEAYGQPEEAVTAAKMRRMVQSAIVYVSRTRAVDRALRFDVVIVEPSGVRHWPDAFRPEADYFL